MTNDLKRTGLSRRGFMGTAAAFGGAAMAVNLGFPAYAQTPVKGGVLKLGLGGGATTDSLDPGLADNPVMFFAGRQWGDCLVNVGPTNEVEPCLAESYLSNEDQSVWTFAIRQGVKFSDGTDMTVDDVVATFKRHADQSSQSGAYGILQEIKDIVADGTDVVFTLNSGNADLVYLLADYHLVVQPGGGAADPTAGIGTGPYRIVSVDPGVRFVFERNPNDWNPDRAQFDGVEFIVINDDTARVSALQAGQVHAVNRVPPKVARLLSRAPKVKLTNISGRGHYVFIMHCDTAPFDNNDLRLALKYAIDREDMVAKILDGYGSVGNDTPINKAYPLFDEALAQREFSIEKAKEHYAASGHDGSPIVLRVADAAFPGAVNAAALFQQTCQEAGIPLEIMRVPDDGYFSDVWNVQPFCASYWGGRPVQDQMYSTAYISTADWNDTRFKVPAFDEAIIAARTEGDEAARKALYATAGQLVNEEGGVICPMFNDYVEAHREELQGWIDDPNHELMNGFISMRTWLA